MIFGHFDIEANGPSPATSSMINLGIVFTNADGNVVGEFMVDILPRKGYNGDKDTLAWWTEQDPKRKAEYERILRNGVPLLDAMERLGNKVNAVLVAHGAKRITWVACPAAYDWMWLQCYWDLYQQHNPAAPSLGFKATCMSTMRSVWETLRGISSCDEMNAYFKATWTGNLLMTHNGLDDARYQAAIYHGMERELRNFAEKLKK